VLPTATTPTAEASPEKATLRTRLGALVSVAKHPLVLIAAGAVISGLLVPALTRGAQNHQKGLEIKSDLVRSMSAAVSPFLAATLANVLVYHGKVPRSYDLAYQQWITQGNEVSTQLQTYFPDKEASLRWGTLSLRMRDVYYFFRLSTPDARHSGTRAAYVSRLESFLRTECDSQTGACPIVDFKSIDRWLAAGGGRFNDTVNFYVEELFFAFRTELNDIVSAVLETKPRL
jgi:hypothetical protein